MQWLQPHFFGVAWLKMNAAKDEVLSQDDLLELIVSFAIPRPPPVSTESNRQEMRQLGRIKESMSWTADLRTVNRQWRNVLDDPMSSLWFTVAQALQLDPPLQLYSGGTYQQVCKLLLEDQVQKVNDAMEQERVGHLWSGCMVPTPTMRRKHPNPERPPVKLPDELAAKICSTAKALESFLRSINFSVLTTGRDSACHYSSFIRYQLFLHLKRMHPTTWLIPTADIEFCWLAHIFRTKVYWDDMTKLGIDPNHSLLLNRGEDASFLEASKATAALWEATFGPSCPYLPADFSFERWSTDRRNRDWLRRQPFQEPYRFFPVMGPNQAYSVVPQNVQVPEISLTPQEVEADLEWFPQLQQGLNEITNNEYDVLGGQTNKDLLYLTHILPSYERFLNLCYQQNHLQAAPPYVLDLVWHAHQADPVNYKRDCLALFDREFWHHPWPNGLGVSSKLTSEFRCAWKMQYGSTIEEDWQLQVADFPWEQE